MTGGCGDRRATVLVCPIRCAAGARAADARRPSSSSPRSTTAARTTVHDALADISGLVRAIGFRDPDQAPVGGRVGRLRRLGSVVLRTAAGRAAPVRRAGRTAAPRAVDAGRSVVPHPRRVPGRLLRTGHPASSNAMAGAVTVVDEVHGFKFFDNRDLIGFVDGTENPDGAAGGQRRVRSATRTPTSPAAATCIVQKYLHDLGAWNALPVEEQERVIGRTKLDDIELADDVKPPNSHVALNVIERRRRQRAQDPARQHAVRRVGERRVRHVLHRLLPHAGGDRADAAQHVPRRPARQHRPHPRLLHGRDRVRCSSSPTADFLDDPPPLPEHDNRGAATRSDASSD